ncbi:hypothetical protein L4C36_11350 [Photobacterium japonica]|uniref:hypothetical protein n=1 Tax=Photobacterium japonica TaxID=2910235 RepID=UPI003D111B40
MDKITLNIMFVIVLVFLSGCTSLGFVSIVNNTDEAVSIKGEFILDSSEYKEIHFDLPPGSDDGWFYEQSSFSKKEIQTILKAVVLSSNGCSVRLNREQIEQLFEGMGRWELTVTEELMHCQVN